ncbi:hypothetical protein OK016_17365 [Vibrio chagasii]|nr:hypothetical protein [Vibrio chagasii]
MLQSPLVSLISASHLWIRRLPLKETFGSLELVALKGVSHTPMFQKHPRGFVELMCHHLLG